MIQTTKKVFHILNKKQKGKAVLIIILMLIGGIMESVSISLILPLISAVMDKNNWNTSWYGSLICRMFQISTQREYIEILLILLIVAFLLKNLYLLLEYYIQYTFIARNRYNMQSELMHSYIRKPYSFFVNSNSGEILRILTSDTSQTFSLLTDVFIFYTEIIVSIILGITILLVSPSIAIGLLIILGLELLTITMILKPIMRRNGTIQRNESSATNKWILQSVNGIKSIKVANTERFFEEHYCKHALKVVDIDRKNQTIANMPRLIIEAFTVSGVLLILLLMVLTGKELDSIVPQLSAFVLAAVRLLPSINRISMAMNQIPFLEGGLDNIIVALEKEKNEKGLEENRGSENNQVSRREKNNFNRCIFFEGISFSYPNSEKKIFNNASFKIYPGQSVGIVGTSGAGKTTAVDIILGLLKPDMGHVYIDGSDIENDMSKWLSQVAYIPQTIFLMDDTIRANIAFGQGDAEISEKDIWEALEEAQMKEYVESLPDGLDTQVGEQGIRLSGGQRQRIGIARALYSNPEFLFFDEATSALDNETENAIMESIENLKGKKTLIIIAHRLSTIENCDVIFRVEEGKVIEDTTRNLL